MCTRALSKTEPEFHLLCIFLQFLEFGDEIVLTILYNWKFVSKDRCMDTWIE